MKAPERECDSGLAKTVPDWRALAQLVFLFVQFSVKLAAKKTCRRA
jgi:hypothetical protein